MQTCIRSYFTLLSIFYTAILQMVNCDLRFYPHEIEVTVNSCVTLEINLTDVNGRVNLKIAENVAEAVPNEMELKENSIKYVSIYGRNPGRSELNITFSNNTGMIYPGGVTQISVYKSEFLVKLGYMMGWTYFITWSICFYPQVYMNFKRKSVIGLNFDYVALSLVGFLLYSVYNCVLFWVPPVQAEYYQRYPKGMIPVQLSDVEFALHSTFIINLVIVQCFMYERGGQTLSRMTFFVLMACCVCLVFSGVFVCLNIIKVLDFIIICSYIKLITSLMKYTPQVILNYKRKSTNGWSIQTVILDLTGGLLSTSQMIIISYNYDDWMSLKGNFSKFGLGISSVLFNIVFTLQHFVLYRRSDNPIDIKKLALENNNIINGKKINLV